MKYIFIDRDGVINRDPGGWTKHSYVTDWKDFYFLPGAIEALKLLNHSGIKTVVISNQAGVNKGYFSKERLAEINGNMIRKVSEGGGNIIESFYCIHRDEDNCACRKPKSGLIEMAAKKYGIDPRNTFIIGDSRVDILAGKNLGIKTVFVLSGKATMDDVKKWDVKPDYIFNNLLDAVKWILAKRKRKAERRVKRERLEKRDEKENTDSIRDGRDRA